MPQRYYAPPGPPDDPWGPYIREAALRFHVPERWVRAVMRQESGGEEQAISSAGAMGLMQLMPETYDEMREQYGLGDDPYDPHNNMLAGVAYIRQMYDHYGAPGFLAAYNAGPGRIDEYLAGNSHLPSETVDYLAAITPHLGNDPPFSGPFASYASLRLARSTSHPATIASLASGCDLDAAYDPKHPCSSLEKAAVAPSHAAPVLEASLSYCDPDAAYDPNRRCRYAPTVPTPETPPERSAQRPTTSKGRAAAGAVGIASVGGGTWAIQVGAFRTTDLARAVVEGARAQAPKELKTAAISFPPVTSASGATLYRARLVHLSANEASTACQALNKRQLPCIIVQPGGA